VKRFSFWSACLGNLFEHYDNALFGFLSPFLAPLIFPGKEPVVALILTYAMIPLGMLARPLGALYFGHMGDRVGRKEALSYTLIGMGLISLLIAFTPTFESIGWASPLLFCIGRFFQNFFAAGESMGGAIYLLENSREEQKDLLSSLYNASTIAGILLASFGVALFSTNWRLLYLLGGLTALFGSWIRQQQSCSYTPLVTPKNPLTVLWKERKSFFTIALISGFAYANYSMALVLMNGFIPLVTDSTKETMATLNSYLLIFDFCLLPICGYLASKISRQKIMLVSALFILLGAAPLFHLLSGASLLLIVGIRLLFVAAGVAFFAPFHAYAQALIAKEHRATVVSLGYAIGSQLLGGPTAAISLWLFKATGHEAVVPLYWILLALASTIIIINSLKITQKVTS